MVTARGHRITGPDVARAERLHEVTAERNGGKPTCFVISEIGAKGSEQRLRADKVFRRVIVPALDAAGYAAPVRSDQINELGLITDQIVQHLMDDDMVVADLTGLNPNVMYELAIRHAVDKPAALLYHPDDEIPFDVSLLRAIPVTTDVDAAEDAREALTATLKSALVDNASMLRTPFRVALDLIPLRHPEGKEASGAESRALLAMMEQIRAELGALYAHVRATTISTASAIASLAPVTVDILGSQRTLAPGQAFTVDALVSDADRSPTPGAQVSAVLLDAHGVPIDQQSVRSDTRGVAEIKFTAPDDRQLLRVQVGLPAGRGMVVTDTIDVEMV